VFWKMKMSSTANAINEMIAPVLSRRRSWTVSTGAATRTTAPRCESFFTMVTRLGASGAGKWGDRLMTAAGSSSYDRR
jgi:hypothetical protein